MEKIKDTDKLRCAACGYQGPLKSWKSAAPYSPCILIICPACSTVRSKEKPLTSICDNHD